MTLAQILDAGGWEVKQPGDGTLTAIRMAPTGGAFGRQVQTLQLDSGGRYLERVDGWGTVLRDVDLRNYVGRLEQAVRDVLL